MTKVKVLSRVLAVIGFIALSATVAHAGVPGDGGNGDGENQLVGFQCYLITHGADDPHVLTLTDQFGDRENVRVGRGRLLCTPTNVEVTQGPHLNQLVGPDGTPLIADHLKCYRIFTHGRKHEHDWKHEGDREDERDWEHEGDREHDGRRHRHVLVNVMDQFSVETLKVHAPRFLCTPAVKTLLTQP